MVSCQFWFCYVKIPWIASRVVCATDLNTKTTKLNKATITFRREVLVVSLKKYFDTCTLTMKVVWNLEYLNIIENTLSCELKKRYCPFINIPILSIRYYGHCLVKFTKNHNPQWNLEIPSFGSIILYLDMKYLHASLEKKKYCITWVGQVQVGAAKNTERCAKGRKCMLVWKRKMEKSVGRTLKEGLGPCMNKTSKRH